jgi:hypothetical protein
VGLLLLRVAVGGAAIVEGGFYLTDQANATFASWAGGLLALALGVSLLIGFLTPIVGIIMGIGALAIGYSLVPPPMSNLFDGKLATTFAAIMTASIAFLGPGAFSLDARLFGRREIIIPPVVRSSR